MKKAIVALPAAILLTGAAGMFYALHPTCYKYNDVWVKGKSLAEVQERYGDFDLMTGSYAAYYIYTDNGGIFSGGLLDIDPDHLKRYYRMFYDENQCVYRIDEGVQPGG